MEALGKLVLALIATVIRILIHALVVVKFWAWFLVDMFDMFVINFNQAIGIGMLMTLVRGYDNSKKDETDAVTTILTGYVYVFMLLGLGWVVHMFIM